MSGAAARLCCCESKVEHARRVDTPGGVLKQQPWVATTKKVPQEQTVCRKKHMPQHERANWSTHLHNLHEVKACRLADTPTCAVQRSSVVPAALKRLGRGHLGAQGCALNDTRCPKKLANHAAENAGWGVHHTDIQWYKHCNKQALSVPLWQ